MRLIHRSLPWILVLVSIWMGGHGTSITWAKQTETELKTVPSVDLERYMGKWYEIAAIPMFFERNCYANTTAEYTLLPDGLVQVRNSCETTTQKRISATGRAKVVEPSTSAKLKVMFLNWFGWRWFAGGDYWIIELAPDYSYSIVGHPAHKYAWILSRTPALPIETLKLLSQKLQDHGYDPCALKTAKQSGGIQSRLSLCTTLEEN